MVLSEEPPDPDPHAPRVESIPAGLYLRPGGGLVAAVRGEWFTLPVPKLDPDKFPVPFHVRPDFPVVVVSGDEVSVPLPAAAGGKPPYTFALAAEVPGVWVDAKAGTLVVAPKELTGTLTDWVAAAVRKTRGNDRARPADRANMIDNYLAVVTRGSSG